MDKAMKTNERVRTYVLELTDNLIALLNEKPPPYSKAFAYSSGEPTTVLYEMGEFAPSIGSIFSMFGFVLS